MRLAPALLLLGLLVLAPLALADPPTPALGACTESHPPCAWDQLACVWYGTTKACVPDVS
jgi:hypothetical protein